MSVCLPIRRFRCLALVFHVGASQEMLSCSNNEVSSKNFDDRGCELRLSRRTPASRRSYLIAFLHERKKARQSMLVSQCTTTQTRALAVVASSLSHSFGLPQSTFLAPSCALGVRHTITNHNGTGVEDRCRSASESVTLRTSKQPRTWRKVSTQPAAFKPLL